MTYYRWIEHIIDGIVVYDIRIDFIGATIAKCTIFHLNIWIDCRCIEHRLAMID
jgi:hypothetical protein